MLFRRIAFLGLALAVVAAGVLQVRLMRGAGLREIHLLLSEQTELQRRIARQDLDLAQLRTPWRVADRLSTMGVLTQAPGPTREAGGSRSSRTNAVDKPVPVKFVTQPLGSGEPAVQWSRRPGQNNRPAAPQ